MNFSLRKFSMIAAGAALLLMGTACSSPGSSDVQDDPSAPAVPNYPTAPITVIVPFPAGGATDLGARLVVDDLAKELGVTITVENRPGASGVTETTRFMSDEPDGYTVLAMVSGPTTFRPAADSNVQYSWDSFDFLGSATSNPYVLIVPSESPWNTVDDLVDAVKEDPSKYQFGTGAAVGPSTFATAGMLTANGIDASEVAFVTFEGDGPAVNAVAGNHVSFASGNASTVLPLLKAGKVKALLQSGSVPLEALGDVPTGESNGFDITNWVGFFTPKGVSPEVVTVWESALKKVADNPDTRVKMANLGVSPNYRSGAELAAIAKDEFATGAGIAKKLGITQ